MVESFELSLLVWTWATYSYALLACSFWLGFQPLVPYCVQKAESLSTHNLTGMVEICIGFLSLPFQVPRLNNDLLTGVCCGRQLSEEDHVELIVSEVVRLSSHVPDAAKGELMWTLLVTPTSCGSKVSHQLFFCPVTLSQLHLNVMSRWQVLLLGPVPLCVLLPPLHHSLLAPRLVSPTPLHLPSVSSIQSPCVEHLLLYKRYLHAFPVKNLGLLRVVWVAHVYRGVMIVL